MLKRLRKFACARDGFAAVEFALIAPVMILMLLGSVELTSALDCNARVGRVAYTSADLVAQATSVSDGDLANISSASTSILYPFPAEKAQITISSLVDDGKGSTKVAWTTNTTLHPVGSTVAVPAGLIVSGSGGSLILAEVTYNYTSAIAYFLKSGMALTDSFYARPRRSLTVAHS